MLDLTKDIQSLTTFRRQSGDFMKQLKKTKRPVVLTVNGKAAAVVQDVGAYQRLLDIAASADEEEAIRQGFCLGPRYAMFAAKLLKKTLLLGECVRGLHHPQATRSRAS
jgi:prevent-host-death family protein